MLLVLIGFRGLMLLLLLFFLLIVFALLLILVTWAIGVQIWDFHGVSGVHCVAREFDRDLEHLLKVLASNRAALEVAVWPKRRAQFHSLSI